MDELSPEEVLEWVAQREDALKAKYGVKMDIQDPEESLVAFKLSVAKAQAHIDILNRQLKAIQPGKLNSIDEEIRLRAEIAEMEGWRAKMQKCVSNAQARIERKKQST